MIFNLRTWGGSHDVMGAYISVGSQWLTGIGDGQTSVLREKRKAKQQNLRVLAMHFLYLQHKSGWRKAMEKEGVKKKKRKASRSTKGDSGECIDGTHKILRTYQMHKILLCKKAHLEENELSRICRHDCRIIRCP